MQELLAITKRKLKPSEFAKVFFDFEPYKYQKNALDCSDRFVQLNWGRQTGKSTVTALRALYEALWKDGQAIIVLAPKQQQAARLFSKIKHFLAISQRKFPELKLYTEIERETRTIIEFSNGSSIECLTIGETGSNIRGITAHFVIIDEVAQIEKEEVWTSIKPMIIATHGKMWLISTPKGVNNYFFKCYKDKALGFTYFHATSYDNPVADLVQVESDREWMPQLLWDEEYLAEFREESKVFFPLHLIERSMKNNVQEREAPLPTCDYFLGLDPATVGLDSTVFAVLERHENWTAIVKYIETQKEDLMQTAGRTLHLHNLFGFRKIFLDKTGLGEGLEAHLLEKGLPIEGIHQTSRTKQDMYQNLKTQMENGLLLLNNDKARKQLSDIQWEYTMENTLKIFALQSRQHKMPGGDDYPTAICLAALALRTPRQPILFGRSRGVFGE